MRVDDLRQVQCAVDAYRAVFYLCRLCDRGQIYCPEGKAKAEILAATAAAKDVLTAQAVPRRIPDS